MSGRVVLDTNIVIALFAKEAAVLEFLEKTDEVFIPSTVLGELYFGARKSARADENIGRIDEFVTESVVLDCNTNTARQYGSIKHQLRTEGKPIPENDIWIAALTMQYQLTLITRDKHFQEVEGLTVEFL
jgi:tRNA(fMet)-specific endonuclease VapC